MNRKLEHRSGGRSLVWRQRVKTGNLSCRDFSLGDDSLDDKTSGFLTHNFSETLLSYFRDPRIPHCRKKESHHGGRGKRDRYGLC
jgi:hypothetical protein